MFYLKKFNTEAERTACTEAQEYLSYTVETDKMNIHPHDYSKNYVTFIALSGGMFKFSGSQSTNKIAYKKNDEEWSTELQVVTIGVNSGDVVLFKGTMTPVSYKGIGNFSASTASFDLQGNIMSLLYGDNFNGQTSLEGKPHAFNKLFNSSKVVNTNNFVLPATTLSSYCYNGMFFGCTSLVKTPKLLATTLDAWCYSTMFFGCTSLTTTPELPATTLSSYCYNGMFFGCTNLTTPPELLATTLVDGCYMYIFNGCTKLNYIKMLATDISASNCLYYWVDGVASSGTFIKSASMSTLPSGVNGVPNGWTVQDA